MSTTGVRTYDREPSRRFHRTFKRRFQMVRACAIFSKIFTRHCRDGQTFLLCSYVEGRGAHTHAAFRIQKLTATIKYVLFFFSLRYGRKGRLNYAIEHTGLILRARMQTREKPFHNAFLL